MENASVLEEAAKRVYRAVRDMAGTPEAAGDFGRGAGGDISRNIDITAEKAVLDYFKEIGFGCTVLGEECGEVALPGSPGGYVIMDAIDGSANAVRGVPFFCCSLAWASQDRLSTIADAVICDLSSGDIYSATLGGGAFFNGSAISVSGSERTYRIVGVNTSGASLDQLAKWSRLYEENNHTRHFGANALEMAYLARGLMDVFVDVRGKIRVQDLAAGYLIIKEAGGVVLDEKLGPLDSGLGYGVRLSFIAASDRGIIDEVVREAL